MNNKSVIVSKGRNIGKVIPKPTPKQAFDGLKMILDVWQENHRVTEEETTKRHYISSVKEVELEKIRSHREVLESYFNHIFAEREKNFSAFFKALDNGLENNNSEVIISSLGAILDLAKDSPLNKDIKKLKEDFFDDSVDEIVI